MPPGAAREGRKHRRNRPMGPVGRVPSNYGDRWDRVYLVPSNFCSWLPFPLFTVGSSVLPQTSQPNLKGKERRVGKRMGGAITGDGEGTGEEKEGIHPTRGPL